MAWYHTNRLFRQIIATATSFSLVFAPTLANAQQAAPSIVIDNRTNPLAPAPSLDRTANGVQQLNIATPNGTGLSHNMFTQYGVEQKGLILNNATTATQTQLGGYVYGNANLHGKAAHVILNEVTGTQASQMLGYTEVAGQKANVVIVNPNGITCNGCGFINTDRVSLATGHPEIDASGKLAALTVSDGLIAFEGKGGDFTAVPVLDILSRRVTLDAKVNAQTARLVAGRSRFDYETGTVHALKTDGSKTPEFAIDSSALGGMYAGQISMLVTEAGAGVRVNGTMAANAGDMTLTADGRLVLNGSMAASGIVAIQAGAVQNAGTLHAGEDVRLTSAADITNTGEVAAEHGLNVTASTVTNAGTMVAAGQSGAVFGATGNINNTGKIGANKGMLVLKATSIANTGVLRAQTQLTAIAQSIVNRQGQMTSGEGEVLLSAASVLDNTLGQIAAEQGNVTLSTQTLSNESGVIQAAVNNTLQAVLYTSDKNSVLTAGQSLKANVETTLENAGQIGAGQSITILAKTLSNTQTGKIYAQDNSIVAQVQEDLSNAGVIATLAPSANITLFAHTITNDAGQLLSSGNLALAAQVISNKAGRSQSGADVTLNAEQFHNMQGVVVGNTIALSGLNTADATKIFDNTSGSFQTSGLLTVAATTLQNAAGTLLSQAGNVQISDYGTHGSLSNLGGTIDAARAVSVKTADYESNTKSQLYAGTSLAVIAQQKLQNSGLIQAGNGLSLSVGGNLGNTGQIAAQGGALSITAGSFVNHGQVGSLGSLDVGALDTVLNDGVFLSDSTLLVKANKNIINDKGIISAEALGDISLQTVGLSNKSGTIQSAKGIAFSLGSLDNSAGTIETGSFINVKQSKPDSDAKITIDGIKNTDAGPIVLNTHGIIQADGNIAVNATQVVNQAGLIESVAGQVALSSVAPSSVASSQVDNSSGIIQAQTSVDLATPILLNQNGQILSLTADTAIAGSSDLVSPVWLNNENGQIKSGGNLHLVAKSWHDDVASIISSVGDMMLSAQQDVSNTGHIVAGQSLTLTAPSLAQATGSVLAAQTGRLSLDLSGTGGLSNAGTIEAVDQEGVVTLVTHAGDITNRGILVAGQNMSLRASGQILNTAQIGSLNGGLSLNATSLVNENEITASGSVSAELSKVLTNSGLIFSGTDLSVSAGQEINNNQALTQGDTIPKGMGAHNKLTLSAPKIENILGQITSQNSTITLLTQDYANDNGVLQAGTDVLINTANLSNLNGRIIAVTGNAELSNGQQTGMSVLNNEGGAVQSYLDTGILADTIDNQKGLINAANGMLTISANQDTGATSVDNTSGNLQAASALSLYAERLNNTLGHIIQKNLSGYVTLQENSKADAVTSFSDQGGVLQAGGDLNIATHSLAGASQLSAGHNLDLVYAGDLQEAVLLQAGADATLKIDGTYTVNAGSGVLAGEAATITAANVTNSGALIAQTGNLTLTSGTDIYNTGLLSAGGGLSLFLPGKLSNVQGAILAQTGSLHISAADGSSSGALLNSSGAIEAEGLASDMVIQAASITNKMATPIVIKKDQVLWSHDYTGREQTTVDIPVPVGLLDAATGLQGTGVLHAYLHYNHKKGSSNSIHVEDYGSSITLTSPAPLMAAGHDMRLTTIDGIINDAGHITAGNDITLSGGSLNNVGYDTEHAFYVTCTSFGGCNWDSKSVTPVFNGTNTTARKKKKLIGLETTWKAAPQYREQWGVAQNQTAATGSIVAGGNISGVFTGNITNETKKASASAGSFDKFTGPAPQSLNGTAAVAAQENMSAQQAIQSGPTLASTSTSSQVSAAAQGQSSPVIPSYEGVGPAHITVPAGVAVSPISGGVTVPTTVSVIAALPGGSALFVPNPAPDAHYLIETNPAYANLNAFHGSEYLLDRLGSQPQDYIFLGDSAFDTQSVQQQLVSATGKTFMGASYQTPTQQMQQLLDSAVQEAGALGLRVGESLTAAQQASLTQSIVWYIPETVAGKTVLAPHLYLAPGQATLQDGAVIAGRNVALVGGSLENSGALSAANALTVQATQGDLNNAGGTMTGGSVALSALQGSIVNQDQLSTYLVTGGQAQAVGKVGSITATSGNASLVAARDILFNGGQLSAAKSASLVAGGNTLFDAVEETAHQSIVQRHYQHSASQTDHSVAQIDAGENLSVVALGGDLKTQAAQFMAGQDTQLSAQGVVTLGSVTNTQAGYTHTEHHGFLNKTSTTSRFESSSQAGTMVASAGNVDLTAGKDMAVAGVVAGGKDVMLQAGGSVAETALKTTTNTFYEKKTSGLFLGGSGASGTVGYKKVHDAQSQRQTIWTPSTVASAQGNLTIAAKGGVVVDGAALAAAQDVRLSGSSVAFTTEQNSITQSVMHKDKSIGVTGGISPDSMVGQAINGALGAKQSGTGVQSALSGIQTGLGEAMSALGGATSNNIIGAQISVGFSSNKNRSSETRTTVQGSTASAGGTLSIVARGDNTGDARNGDVHATAAHLSGQDVDVHASRDITLDSGVNTDHTEATSSSKSASIGVEASVGMQGAGVSVTASASASHQHSKSDSMTHVDTVIQATDTVHLTTTGTTTLDGAEVNGERVDVKSGMLVISSPQDTASYNSNAESGGFSVSIPVYGAGSFGGSAHVAGQTIKDTYRSTEKVQSGLYAGNGGLDVDVSGNTTLRAGAFSSTADKSLNHFHTGSLDAGDVSNTSRWSGTSFAAGGGFTSGGSLTDAAKTITVAVGHVDHDEQSVTHSLITGTIDVETGSSTGAYSTNAATTNGHLDNNFNATKVNNTLQTQVAAETAVETAVEVGIQAYDKWGTNSSSAVGKKTESSQKNSSVLNTEGWETASQPSGGEKSAVTSASRQDETLALSQKTAGGDTGGLTSGVQQGASLQLGLNSVTPGTDYNHYTIFYNDGANEVAEAHASKHVPGTSTANEAVSWAAVGKVGLIAGTAVPGPVGTAFSTALAWQQWQAGDKTGAAVTAGLGLLNSVGIDASAARVVLSGLKEEQAAATVGLNAAKSEMTGVSGAQLAQGAEHEAGLSSASLCFVAGTFVLTPAGYRQIEALRVGDKVISRDEVRGLTVVEPILQLFHHHNQRILSVSVARQSKLEVLGATSGHPFYVVGRGWTEAGRLHPGDEIRSAAGDALHVLSVAVRPKNSDTYNFEVKKTHSYFVGKLRAWVHNACGQDVPKENLPNGRSVEEFYGEINKLPPGERVAKVKEMAKDVAQSSGMVKDNKLSRINNRDVYVGKNGKLYALDTQHGTFEVLNPKTGRHLGEVDFNFELNKNADISGSHDLKVK